MKFTELKNEFKDFAKNLCLPESIQIKSADVRIGKKAAIVHFSSKGSMSIIEGYSSYSELSNYMRGYVHAKENSNVLGTYYI